jgi:hypothetical protein
MIRFHVLPWTIADLGGMLRGLHREKTIMTKPEEAYIGIDAAERGCDSGGGSERRDPLLWQSTSRRRARGGHRLKNPVRLRLDATLEFPPD